MTTRRIDILPDLARRTPVVDPNDHDLWASLGCTTAFGQTRAVAVADTGIHIDLARAYDGRAISADDLRLLERAAADERRFDRLPGSLRRPVDAVLVA